MLDVLIPTYNRPGALSVTLTSLYFQDYKNFNIVISEQGESDPSFDCKEIKTLIRAFQLRGQRVSVFLNLPIRGMAQQRQFLLDKADARYVLFLDDDLIVENFVIGSLVHAMESEQCGFVGTGTIGLNYIDDDRPHEQKIEFWDGKVEAERIIPQSEKWFRYRIHSAANLYHIQKKFHITPVRRKKYKLAWASACVLFDREKLVQCGGFDFWKDIPPEHCGEDVAAQLRVMDKFGGCGILPCGVYHQELETTVPNRKFNIPERIDLFKTGQGN
jgi:glycosyltransferase involved in cell wall biosynthesis